MMKFQGSTVNDNLVTQNSVGSEVARFYNDYICRFNGGTVILGMLLPRVNYIQQDPSHATKR